MSPFFVSNRQWKTASNLPLHFAFNAWLVHVLATVYRQSRTRYKP